ncbi:Exosome complex component rrp42 [Diatrype stigma]|uniref:Ribosomal RNA-processing protein 42 n=1 Tax=Diatrype stigma TaxID=117547 RepID=A0AAN9UV46_9PEZI
MATSQHLLLSPAELAYLHSSLRLSPPIRPDGRTAAQFRPLTAETGILPGANGSARVCFSDGTEAIVGAKAEVAKTAARPSQLYRARNSDGRRDRAPGQTEAEREGLDAEDENQDDEDEDGAGENDWVEMTVEIPGYRDDDSSTVFLATMLSEALLADGEFTKKLWINRRFHWKLYLDIILISPPLSYPLPLLSLTTHLALLSTRLPRLKSEGDEDPMFDDDWAVSTFLYPQQQQREKQKKKEKQKQKPSSSSKKPAATSSSPPPQPVAVLSRPPITLLVISVGDNIIFDPSKEELAVADSALAVSVGEVGATAPDEDGSGDAMDVDVDVKAGAETGGRNLRLLSVRTIDPPSRLTAPGVPNAVNAAAWGHAAKDPGARTAETDDVEGVWKAPRGGTKFAVLSAMVQKVLERGGIADEVLEGLEGVELE